MGRFAEMLKEIAMEDDSDKRLELSTAFDAEVEKLDSDMETFEQTVSERDAYQKERDEWKQRYADRFFDGNEGATDEKSINVMYNKEVKEESKPLGYAALWN